MISTLPQTTKHSVPCLYCTYSSYQYTYSHRYIFPIHMVHTIHSFLYTFLMLHTLHNSLLFTQNGEETRRHPVSSNSVDGSSSLKTEIRRRMDKVGWADRQATGSHITTLYKCGEQKRISQHMGGGEQQKNTFPSCQLRTVCESTLERWLEDLKKIRWYFSKLQLTTLGMIQGLCIAGLFFFCCLAGCNSTCYTVFYLSKLSVQFTLLFFTSGTRA